MLLCSPAGGSSFFVKARTEHTISLDKLPVVSLICSGIRGKLDSLHMAARRGKTLLIPKQMRELLTTPRVIAIRATRP